MANSQMIDRVVKDAQQRALKSVMENISIYAGSVAVHERGFSVYVNVNLDDVGGDSYNPEYHLFSLSGNRLPEDTDIGEKVEEIEIEG